MLDKRTYVDTLVKNFWKLGYMTVKRKFGTYLPEPEKVGVFDIDIVARQKKDYAIGITLAAEDINNSNLLEKLSYLATRHTKFSNRKVQLFVGVASHQLKKVKQLIENLDDEVKKNIKLISITETNIPSIRRKKKTGKNLFA
ncbi:MAG: hypothetical protein EHM47_13515 [Ignavibacteriales bacterium]|nr:MAG: hypothetical protein EHM47_13515 [Ignavibacteriales bacterium]